MKIISPAFADNTPIPSQYTCDGANINPPLSFTDVPSGAQSLVLIVDDPNSLSGDWVHWILYNISPSTVTIPEHISDGVAEQGITSFGAAAYGGPCPPSGNHRYLFRLYALDVMVTVQPGESVDKTLLEEKMQGHILDTAQLIGLYARH
ncbi:MAG: YbhB/YbcL family Raf kinase inhibitor-like protein [Patescibacteria group bacterium]